MINCIPEISIITNIELFATKKINSFEIKLLKQFVSYSIIHPLNQDLVEKTIQIRKNYNIKLPDAVIAATAIVQNLTLITRNIKDFQGIQDLKIINPQN